MSERASKWLSVRSNHRPTGLELAFDRSSSSLKLSPPSLSLFLSFFLSLSLSLSLALSFSLGLRTKWALYFHSHWESIWRVTSRLSIQRRESTHTHPHASLLAQVWLIFLLPKRNTDSGHAWVFRGGVERRRKGGKECLCDDWPCV